MNIYRKQNCIISISILFFILNFEESDCVDFDLNQKNCTLFQSQSDYRTINDQNILLNNIKSKFKNNLHSNHILRHTKNGNYKQFKINKRTKLNKNNNEKYRPVKLVKFRQLNSRGKKAQRVPRKMNSIQSKQHINQFEIHEKNASNPQKSRNIKNPKQKSPLNLTKNIKLDLESEDSLQNATQRLMNEYIHRSNLPNGLGLFRTLNTSLSKVKKNIVRIHNLLRARVSPPASNMLAVSWHSTAALQAQNWAKQCGLRPRKDAPEVRWTPRYGVCGQNVYVSRKKKRWGQVIHNWWGGRRHFRYDNYRNNLTKVDSYTQLAWYSSHKVGCGFSKCSNSRGKIYFRYVCNYCPTGNDPSRLSRPYTRGRPCSYCQDSCRTVCQKGRCKLCTNACAFSDLWLNCQNLFRKWPQWLCNTKTQSGVIRFKHCRATCQCNGKIT